MNRTAIAVEIAATKVSAVAAELCNEEIVLLHAFHTMPHQGVLRGRIVEPGVVSACLESCLRVVEESSRRRRTQVALAIGGLRCELVRATETLRPDPPDKPISQEDLDELFEKCMDHVEEERPESEAFAIDPIYYETEDRGTVDNPLGLRTFALHVDSAVHCAAVEDLEALDACLQHAGKTPGLRVASAVAAGYGSLREHEMNSGALVVDLGHDSTRAAYFESRVCAYAFTTPLGARHLTSDLAMLLEIDPAEAEQLKLRNGRALASNAGRGETLNVSGIEVGTNVRVDHYDICRIIESRMRETARAIRNGFAITQPWLRSTNPSLTLVGGGSLLPDCEELFAQEFPEFHVRLGEPRFQAENLRLVRDPRYAAAVGAATYALRVGAPFFEPMGRFAAVRERIQEYSAKLLGRPSD